MQISSKILYRLGGSVALAGGLLRIIASFIPYHEGAVWLEGFSALIDVCLLFGLIAIYLRYADRLGRLGVVAFVLSTTGVASIVGPDTIKFEINFYEVGAFTMIAGLLLLSIQMLRNRILVWASSLWIMSFLLTVLAIVFAHVVFIIGAGVSFGIAYTLAGIQLVQQQKLGL